MSILYNNNLVYLYTNILIPKIAKKIQHKKKFKNCSHIGKETNKTKNHVGRVMNFYVAF